VCSQSTDIQDECLAAFGRPCLANYNGLNGYTIEWARFFMFYVFSIEKRFSQLKKKKKKKKKKKIFFLNK
jgi:hypothetical protein